MTIKREVADEPFFREWKQRKQGEHRSLKRAQRVKTALNLDTLIPPLLTVVGSKGKATTTIYASATITAASIQVGTLTSPPVITNRERIRINGQAISNRAYQNLSLQLASILDELSSDESDEGYLSPSGLFTLMGLRYMIDAGCDVAVLEAGMGGKSDEVSLFPPSVVAVTSIFGEHLGVLGKDIVEIAHEKIGVVADSTKALLTIPQSPAVSEVIATELKQYRCDLTVIKESSSPHGINLPPGLSGHNAVLGIQAGHRLLELQKLSVAKHESLQRVLSTIKTPGRLSLHEDRTGRTWVVDAAINENGVASALEWTKHRMGRVDTVLVSIPSGKDVAGVRRVLDHHPYVPVRISTEHLNFDNNEWGTDLISFEEIDQHITGTCILAVGTWSFVGAVLDRLGVNYEVSYSNSK